MSYAKLHTPDDDDDGDDDDDDDDKMCHWKAQIPAADHEIHNRHYYNGMTPVQCWPWLWSGLGP